MHDLTPEGLRVMDEVANRHGVSRDAVVVLARALADGGGYQAQFNHPDLGGMGQWSRGGMIMVGDMFNHGLKHRVDMLCNELAPLVQDQRQGVDVGQSQTQGGAGVSLFVRGAASSSQWWPESFGAPASVGAQNDMRYAFFPNARRLAIQIGGVQRVYDTGDHFMSGFSQQQGGDQSLTFTSQFGLVRVDDLPLVSPHTEERTSPVAAPCAAPHEPAAHAPATQTATASAPSEPQANVKPAGADILTTIERLADLRQKGILTDEEFSAKKAELLSRL